MKKVTALFLTLLCLLLAACNKESMQKSTTPTDVLELNLPFLNGDAEVINKVSTKDFQTPIICTYNGKTITVNPPVFTGLPVTSVYSCNQNYTFETGSATFHVSLEGGAKYFLIDKTGKILDNDYIIPEGTEFYMPSYTDGGVIGNGVIKEQTGTPGSYQQQLLSVSGEVLSEKYDSIGYFYNGLALVTRNQKVGLIDEQGNVVLEPTIAYDLIQYPPKDTGYDLNFLWGDAFVLPIDGEMAIITIDR